MHLTFLKEPSVLVRFMVPEMSLISCQKIKHHSVQNASEKTDIRKIRLTQGLPLPTEAQSIRNEHK